MHPGFGCDPGHTRRVGAAQFPARDETQRQPHVIGDRSDDVMLDWQTPTRRPDAALEQEVRDNRDAAAGIFPLMLELARRVQGIGHYRLRAQR